MKFLEHDYYFFISNQKKKINIINILSKKCKETKESGGVKIINYLYERRLVKDRKIFHRIRQGVTETEKKNSLKRDYNYLTIQKFLNIMSTKTDKNTVFKHLNTSIEFFFYILHENNDEFAKYKNYSSFVYLIDNVSKYNDFNLLLDIFLPRYYSLFDIRTKKNRKKGRLVKKYVSEISYIPPFRRLKNTLKVINKYSENFKNYELWERLFWMFLMLILNDKNLYLIKRRSYIYKKSIKFFTKRKLKK